MLEICLMGEFAIVRDGKPLTLPRSRKTLALLAFLIMTGRRHNRTKLCNMFWELPNDPRGALRWSLSKLRTLVDEKTCKRIISDGNNVSFELAQVEVDAIRLRIASDQGFDEMPLEKAQALAAGDGGAFLENLDLPECHQFQAWRTAEQTELAHLQMNLLISIIRRAEDDELMRARYSRKVEDLKRSFPELSIASKPALNDPLVELKVRDINGVIALPEKPSIVVLPFENMSDRPDQEYFVDGISEDIITALAKSRLFFVIARNSSFAFKNQSVDTKEIARQLGVQYILEGSVRRIGDRVRITAQFVEAITGRHIWAERYDREFDDIFGIQDEITGKIASSVGKEFFSAEINRAHKDGIRNPNAREIFLRGVWRYAQFKADENREAMLIAERGLKEHPEDAELHALVSMTSLIDFIYGWNRSRPDSRTMCLAAAKQSVELDKSNSLCCRILGDAQLYSKQHDAAIRTLQRCVAIDPNDSDSISLLGGALGYAGDFDGAFNNIRLAARLSPRDPFAVTFCNHMAHAAMIAGHDISALEWSHKAKEEKSDFPGGYRIGAVMLALTGRMEEAKSDLRSYLQLAPDTTIDDLREVLPIKHEAAMERYLGALRMAGMPEKT